MDETNLDVVKFSALTHTLTRRTHTLTHTHIHRKTFIMRNDVKIFSISISVLCESTMHNLSGKMSEKFVRSKEPSRMLSFGWVNRKLFYKQLIHQKLFGGLCVCVCMCVWPKYEIYQKWFLTGLSFGFSYPDFWFYILIFAFIFIIFICFRNSFCFCFGRHIPNSFAVNKWKTLESP